MANVKFEFAPGFTSDQVEVGIGDYVRVFKRSEQPFDESEVIARALLRDHCAVFVEVGAPVSAPATVSEEALAEGKRKR